LPEAPLSLAELIANQQITLPAAYLPTNTTSPSVGAISNNQMTLFIEQRFIDVPLQSAPQAPATLIDPFNPNGRLLRLQGGRHADPAATEAIVRERLRHTDVRPEVEGEIVIRLTNGDSFTGRLNRVTSQAAFFQRPGRIASRIIDREDIAPASRPLLFDHDYLDRRVRETVAAIDQTLTLIRRLEQSFWLEQFFIRAPKVERYVAAGDSLGAERVALPVTYILPHEQRQLGATDGTRVLARGEAVTGAIFYRDGQPDQFVFRPTDDAPLVSAPIDAFVPTLADWRAIEVHEAQLKAYQEQEAEARERRRAIEREQQRLDAAAAQAQRLREQELEEARQERQAEAAHRRLMLWEAERARRAIEAAEAQRARDTQRLIEEQRREADATEESVRELERLQRLQRRRD
jgi:hypothetical protein